MCEVGLNLFWQKRRTKFAWGGKNGLYLDWEKFNIQLQTLQKFWASPQTDKHLISLAYKSISGLLNKETFSTFFIGII